MLVLRVPTCALDIIMPLVTNIHEYIIHQHDYLHVRYFKLIKDPRTVCPACLRLTLELHEHIFIIIAS